MVLEEIYLSCVITRSEATKVFMPGTRSSCRTLAGARNLSKDCFALWARNDIQSTIDSPAKFLKF
jgi:hypothetical protein